MDIKEKASEQLETRVKKLENFIANKGVGSSYLSRARRVQRNVNLAIVFGSAITVAGLAVWAMSKSNED